MTPGARRAIHHLSTDRALQLAIAIVVLCLVVQGSGLATAWRFDRSLIDNGAWWLLLSGNFAHLGVGHLVMNLAGLALVVALVWERFGALEWLLLVLGGSVSVGVGLWQLNPEIGWYVGFSGTLHGLIIAGALADLRVWPRSAALLLAGVIAKLIWEQVGGALPGSEAMAGGHVVVDSHLYGAIGGGVLGLLLLLLNRGRAAT